MHLLSKSRYRGTVLLSAGILLTGFVNFLFSHYRVEAIPETDHEAELRLLDSLLAQLQQPEPEGPFSSESAGISETGNKAANLRAFNLNSVNHDSWLAMGLPEKAYESLERYRRKGGVFRKAEQVHKIPFLNREQALALEKMFAPDTGRLGIVWNRSARKPQVPAGPFDLNLADSMQLRSVFGIGAKTAARIIRYREDLGGFIRKEQLYEVWGLDSLVAEELMETSFLTVPPGIRKINPNTATEEQLCAHPYIRKGLGRLIVRYRRQHPPFSKPEDLLGIRLFRPEQLEKLRPYLSFD